MFFILWYAELWGMLRSVFFFDGQELAFCKETELGSLKAVIS